jgi:hypothetical protein
VALPGKILSVNRLSGVAHLRGAFVGAVSGAVSIAAHGWAAGSSPSGSGAVLLVVGAGVMGALTAWLAPLRGSIAGLILALAAGQTLGHQALAAGSPHHHGGFVTSTMLSAHVMAATLAAIIILGAERAYRVTSTALARAVPPASPGVAANVLPRTGYRAHAITRIVFADGLRTRAPPFVI